MRFKRGDYVIYEHPQAHRHQRLVGRVTSEAVDGCVNVRWLNERFPVISWREAELNTASVVDVLAAVVRKGRGGRSA